MIVSSPLELIFGNVFYRLDGFLKGTPVFIKLEGFSVTGSIKIKSALNMIRDLEERQLARPGVTTLVESSSGNLGVALSLVCQRRGFGFVCVSDPNISELNRQLIKVYGGRLIIVDTKDANGGYLHSRLQYIHELVSSEPNHLWLNQYANLANPEAHKQTAREIWETFPKVDFLFIGTGTTGTLMGVREEFARSGLQTKIIAVEPEGSVTFDPKQKGRRLIPGIGTSRRPELLDGVELPHVTWISERKTIEICHRVLKEHGLLIGGSTGTVIAAILRHEAEISPDSVVVAISPDLGDKYLSTIYSPEWVNNNYK